MKTTLYYVILRGVPGFRNCYLNLNADKDAIVHSKPHLFSNEAAAGYAADAFVNKHGGTARVHLIQITSP